MLHEISEEALEVAGEVVDGAGGDEAEGRHLTVGARVQVEGVAADRDVTGDGLAGCGDGAGTAERCEPDHDFVVVGASCAGGEEGVVGDIGDEGGAGVAAATC